MAATPDVSSVTIDWKTLFSNAADAYTQVEGARDWHEAYARHMAAAHPDLIEHRLADVLMDARMEQLLAEVDGPIGDVRAWYAQYLQEHQERLVCP